MPKEILLTGNFNLAFTHYNVGHYQDSCKEKGCSVRVVNSMDMHKEKTLPYAVINMAGYPNDTHLRFLRTLEIQGVKTPNPVYQAAIADDKFLSNLEFRKLGLPVPKTLDLHVASFDRTIPEHIGDELGFPCVIKYPRMGYGMGIHLVKSQEELSSLFDLLSLCSSKSANYMSNTNLVAQEFIPSTQGKQLKVFVLNGDVVGTYYYENADGWKIGRKGDVNVPRTDNTPGGKVTFELSTNHTPEIEENCIYVCESLELKFACVDVFFGPQGYLFNEINASPGFHRCYPDRPMAHLVVDYLLSL